MQALCKPPLDEFGIEYAAYILKTGNSTEQHLRNLVQAGWLEKAGPRLWKSSQQGAQLGNARACKRFPIEKGRAIVERVVERAEAINSFGGWSFQIDRIVLFGSVLTGTDGDEVGDVDLIVLTSRRNLPNEEIEQLRGFEEWDVPQSWLYKPFWRPLWGYVLIVRAIKAVSPRRISVHETSDLELPGLQSKVVYERAPEHAAVMQAEGRR